MIEDARRSDERVVANRLTRLIDFLRRHPVLAWAVAWAIAHVGYWFSGVLNEPRTRPLWLAFVPGVIGWALAGAASFPFRRYRDGLAIWAGAFTLGWLGSGVVMMMDLDFGIFVVLGLFAVAVWLGTVVSMHVTDPRVRPSTWIVVPGAWDTGFLFGGWVGLLASYLLPDLLEDTLDLTESGMPELTLGIALGGAIGGGVAAVPGVAVRSLLKARAGL